MSVLSFMFFIAGIRVRPANRTAMLATSIMDIGRVSCEIATIEPATAQRHVMKRTALGWSSPLPISLLYRTAALFDLEERARLMKLSVASAIGMANSPSGSIINAPKVMPLLTPSTDVPATSTPHIAEREVPSLRYI